MSAEPRLNVYVCPNRSGMTVTVDVDEGVTPFLLRCRATADCQGMARSCFYPRGPKPPHVPEAAWEWYRPVGAEYAALTAPMKEHVDKGGVAIRARTNASPVMQAASD